MNSLSSLKVYTLTTFPHFLHPNNALVLNENVDEEETYTPSLGIRATYPLQLATDLNAKVEDNIVLKLVEQKNQYLHDVDKLTGNYKRSCRYRAMGSVRLDDMIFNSKISHCSEEQSQEGPQRSL